MSHTLTIHELQQLEELPAIFHALKVKFPVKLTFRHTKDRNAQRFKRMNALIRDICRHKHDRMKITEREHKHEVERWKLTTVWPRYDNPEPDPLTGEVMYMPMSREDLDDDQIKGVCQWLDHYIDTNGIPRHGPQDNWQVPAQEARA